MRTSAFFHFNPPHAHTYTALVLTNFLSCSYCRLNWQKSHYAAKLLQEPAHRWGHTWGITASAHSGGIDRVSILPNTSPPSVLLNLLRVFSGIKTGNSCTGSPEYPLPRYVWNKQDLLRIIHFESLLRNTGCWLGAGAEGALLLDGASTGIACSKESSDHPRVCLGPKHQV